MSVRWQYRIVNIGVFFAGPRMGRALSHFGQHGWEFVAIYDKESNWIAEGEKGFMLFKRPVPAGAEPDGPWTELWTSTNVDEALAAANSQPV